MMEEDQERVIRWADAVAQRGNLAALSGLELMRSYRDGTLPPPPMVRLIGFRCTLAEPGEIVMELDPDGSVENSLGILHGGALATMLDTAMGAAAHTLLVAGQIVVTLDLAITWIRPLPRGSGSVRVRGKVVHAGRRNTHVSGEVLDQRDRLLATAVGNFTTISSG